MSGQPNRKKEPQDEIDKKFEAVVRKLLNTPPQPKAKGKQKRSENDKSAIIEEQ